MTYSELEVAAIAGIAGLAATVFTTAALVGAGAAIRVAAGYTVAFILLMGVKHWARARRTHD